MITFDFEAEPNRNALLLALQKLNPAELLASIPFEDHLIVVAFKGTPQEKTLSRFELKRLLYRRPGCGC